MTARLNVYVHVHSLCAYCLPKLLRGPPRMMRVTVVPPIVVNIIHFLQNPSDIVKKKLWAVPMSVAARTGFWDAAADPLGRNGLSQPSVFPPNEWGIQGGLAKHHAWLCIALEANPHDFPITPSRGGEGGALPRIRDNSRGAHLAALVEPMIQRAPMKTFLGHIPEPPPFQTVIRNRGVHVTTMVDQRLGFTWEVGLEGGSVARFVGCSVAHHLAACSALLSHHYVTPDSRSDLPVVVYLTVQRFRSRLLVGVVGLVGAVGVAGPWLPMGNCYRKKDGNRVCNLWLHNATTHLHKLHTPCPPHMHMSKHSSAQSATRCHAT